MAAILSIEGFRFLFRPAKGLSLYTHFPFPRPSR